MILNYFIKPLLLFKTTYLVKPAKIDKSFK